MKPLREKIRNRLKKNNPWNGKKHSDESKKKMSEAKIGNKINVKKVRRLDTGQVFDSISDAAESIGVSGKHLSYRLCKNRKTFPIFEYV